MDVPDREVGAQLRKSRPGHIRIRLRVRTLAHLR